MAADSYRLIHNKELDRARYIPEAEFNANQAHLKKAGWEDVTDRENKNKQKAASTEKK
jgi:hypothetical protein